MEHNRKKNKTGTETGTVTGTRTRPGQERAGTGTNQNKIGTE